MSTYATMQTRIADELARSDLTSQIKLAILSAVSHYEGNRFWFNEGQATASTTDGTEYYAVPSDFQSVDSLRITVNGTTYTLEVRPWAWMDEVQSNALYKGQPVYYAIYAEQLRLYPIPDATYTLKLSYLKSFTTLSADGDTNAWMVEGERLIRMRAKWDLFSNVIRTAPEEETKCKAAEMDELDKLESRTVDRTAVGRIIPSL